MTLVTAAIIRDKGRVLLARRTSPDGTPGGWEFPGGKVEDGEDGPAALARELREELAIEVEVGSQVAESVYHYERGTIRLVAFAVTWLSGEIRLIEHAEVAWVKPEDLLDYELLPADIPIAREMSRLGASFACLTEEEEAMEIVHLRSDNEHLRSGVAALLRESFPHSYADSAEEEVVSFLEEGRVALVAVIDGEAVGFVGGIPQYGETGWELHPLVVRKRLRGRAIGTRLLRALESEVSERGGLTVYLGTDDEFFQTSLGGVDLYCDLWQKVRDIRNLKQHPFEFYQKNGYMIVGVIPDANGPGKPDIMMAKRVAKIDRSGG